MSAILSKHASFVKSELDAISASALRVLLYYDLFSYPLTVEEIRTYCSVPRCSSSSVRQSLDDLCRKKLVFQSGQFYSVRNNTDLFERRISGNQLAEEIFIKACERSKLIASFPFVRGVCISGSYSKNYFDATTDLDFFIIAEPNRLWICRTFLVLFKKIFLLNSKKYFCVNYFLDSDNLLIPDQNIFTATEIITLLPMYNYELYREFFTKNHWVNSFFPNREARQENGTLKVSNPIVKRVFESLLKGNLGEWLDRFLFRKTLNRWKKKFNFQSIHEFEVNMRSRRNVSKHHPQGFQFQVLKRYEENIRSFEHRYQLNLN